MNLKIYNQDNCKTWHTGDSSVRISKKSGLFQFTKVVSTTMELQKGDRVICTEDDNGNFYFAKSNEKNGFPLSKKEESNSFLFHSIMLAKILIAENEKAITYNIDEKPIINGKMKLFRIDISRKINVKEDKVSFLNRKK